MSSDQAPPNRARWGQARRLAFIDLRLQFDARINRRDLIEFFDISTPQASADLATYLSRAPQNMKYDPSSRTYVALETFHPIDGRTAATSYLDELQRLERGVIEKEESFVGFVSPTGVVAAPARAIEASEVAVLVQAIRDGNAIRIQYQSMHYDEPLVLTISPHAIAFDGLRWHARAWCHDRSMFRDFAIGRLVIHGVDGSVAAVDASADIGWTTMVHVVLIPHPGLSDRQQDVVMRDYGMAEGKLSLPCRKAMLFYTLRHMNLDLDHVLEDPARQHVIVGNRKDVDRWVEEDRIGAGPSDR